MRLFAVAFAFVLATCFAPAALHAETFDWPGHGKVSVSVPSGWSARGERSKAGFDLIATPKGAPVAYVLFSLIESPSGKPLKVEQLKGQLENMTRALVKVSAEKAFDPKPLTLSQGSGLMVEITDASQVGKPQKLGYYKAMRRALAFLDERVMLDANILFNDSSQPEVESAMSLLSSLRFERSATTSQAPSTSSGPFTFTTPQSHVIVKVTDPSLHIDNTNPHPNYFRLSRNDPELNLSALLGPASAYKDLKWLLDTDSSAIAQNGFKPTRVEMLHEGEWEILAYDLRFPGGKTNSHLRAQRVQAGTWIHLHIAATSARPPAKIRAELLGELRQVEVVEK
jgi:hypothetical protein